MITSPITIDEGQVTILPVAGGVWMTQHQIADLFGVFVSAIGSNIRSILKNEVLCEEKVCRHEKTKSGGTMTLYDLEMITALAFRIKSHKVEQFRRWIIEQALHTVIIWKIPGTETTPN